MIAVLPALVEKLRNLTLDASSMKPCALSSPCRAAWTPRSPRPCSPSRVTTSSVCRCSSTTTPAAPDAGRGYRHLLHHRRPARRAPRRRRDRHPPLHRQLRIAVRRRRGFELRPRVRRRPDADSVRALQQRSEVRGAPRPRRRATARRRWPPATTRASIHGRRTLSPAARARSRQGPVRTSCSRSPRRRWRRRSSRLGDLDKPTVREHARRLGLRVAEKPDSQEICFVPDDDYAAFVEREAPELARAGAIVSADGRVIGTHDGVHRFTVGQRKGLRLSSSDPLYVVAIDAASARVTVGPKRCARPRVAVGGRGELDLRHRAAGLDAGRCADPPSARRRQRSRARARRAARRVRLR